MIAYHPIMIKRYKISKANTFNYSKSKNKYKTNIIILFKNKQNYKTKLKK